MIKNKTELLEEMINKFTVKAKEYVDGLDRIGEDDNISIDSIEADWANMNKATREIIEEITNEAINQVNEKELISKKKLKS